MSVQGKARGLRQQRGGNKDASGDVAMGEVDGVVIEPPEDADQRPLETARRARKEDAGNGSSGGQAQKSQFGKPRGSSFS